MGELLMRRRGMVLASGGDGSLLYSLYNSTDVHPISTGVCPLTAGLSTTIVMDITTTSNPTSSGSVASLSKLFAVYGDDLRKLCVGKYGRSNTYLSVWWMTTDNAVYSQLSGTTAAAGRKRFVLTHEADSNNLIVYSKMGTSDIYQQTVSNTFTAYPDSQLSISGAYNNTNQRAPGNVAKFEVYNRIWTADERGAFFA